MGFFGLPMHATTTVSSFLFMSFFVRRTNIARAIRLLYSSYASHVPIASNILSFSFASGIVFFCQVDKFVVEFVEEARKVALPVTRATIQSFGVAARNKPLAEA